MRELPDGRRDLALRARAPLTATALDAEAALGGVYVRLVEPLLGPNTPSIEPAVETVQVRASAAVREGRDARGLPRAQEQHDRVRAGAPPRVPDKASRHPKAPPPPPGPLS